MGERKIFAVIADELGSEVMQIEISKRLVELEKEEIQELVEYLAENNFAWKDVLKKNRIAVIFDPETGDKISINRNSLKFIIDM